MTVRARLTDGEIEMSAGPRLAEGQGGQVFAASDGGEQSLFQLGAPFGGDDGSPTEMHQHHHGCRGARLRQLLERPRHFSQAATRAAVFDGDKQAQHSAAPEGRDVFAREAAFAIHLFGIARDDFLRRHGVLGHQLFGLGHKRSTPTRIGSPAATERWRNRRSERAVARAAQLKPGLPRERLVILGLWRTAPGRL